MHPWRLPLFTARDSYRRIALPAGITDPRHVPVSSRFQGRKGGGERKLDYASLQHADRRGEGVRPRRRQNRQMYVCGVTPLLINPMLVTPLATSCHHVPVVVEKDFLAFWANGHLQASGKPALGQSSFPAFDGSAQVGAPSGCLPSGIGAYCALGRTDYTGQQPFGGSLTASNASALGNMPGSRQLSSPFPYWGEKAAKRGPGLPAASPPGAPVGPSASISPGAAPATSPAATLAD